MTHQCPAEKCGRNLPDHMLMCRPHWYMVPSDLRAAVWATYRNGAGVGTLPLWQAQRDAIEAVNGKIGATS